MRRDEALRILGAHTAELAELGLRSVALIGSVARDQAGESSDVDLLVELAPDMGLREYMGLKFRLEEWLGRPVDLVTRQALRPEERAAIEPEAILVS